MKKSSKIILAIVIVLVIALIGGGVFLLIDNKNKYDKEIAELKNQIASFDEKLNGDIENSDEKSSDDIENSDEKSSDDIESSDKKSSGNINKNESNNKNTTNAEPTTTSNINGLYNYSKDFNDDNQNGIGYFLYLYNDGTFKYEHNSHHATGEIGTYTINGNTLTLNAQYYTGSDVGISTANKIINLKINSDGSITDQNKFFSYDDFYGLDKKYKDFDFSNITMTKSTEAEEKEYIKAYPSIQEIINQSKLYNAIETTEIDYSKYKGHWSNEETSDELTITNINNKNITFDWMIYRTKVYDNINTVFTNENQATFTAMEDGFESTKISGIITFTDNSITIVVEESVDAYVKAGHTDTFYIE